MVVNGYRWVFAVAALAMGSCKYARPANVGDDDASTGDGKHDDAAIDGVNNNFPAVPTYGGQIDRVGRPLINVMLNHTFDTDPTTQGGARDQYNADVNVGNWTTAWKVEIAKNLAIFDVVDQAPNYGCENQFLYDGNVAGGGGANTSSYFTLASMLADDRLYVDTSKSTCTMFAAVELASATGTANSTCGGLTPTYDVADFMYSLILYGVSGFSTDGNFTPVFHDNASAHTDVSTTTFPFLGAPL